MEFSTAKSPTLTQSNSVMSVMSIHTPLPIFAPKSRSTQGRKGVPRRCSSSTRPAMPQYMTATASVRMAQKDHMGMTTGW